MIIRQFIIMFLLLCISVSIALYLLTQQILPAAKQQMIEIIREGNKQ